MKHQSSSLITLLILGLFFSASLAHGAPDDFQRAATDGASLESASLNTTIQGDTILRFAVAGVRSSDGGVPSGTQILVGRHPTGPLAGHEGELALLTKSGWTFQAPSLGDQVFDEDAAEQYVYTGVSSLFGGVWVDSKWRRLTPQAPKWEAAGTLGADVTLSAEDHRSWFFVSAQGGDFTVTLPNPFAGDLQGMGMELILEPFDGASGTAFVQVAGGGSILTPDGDLVTQYALPRLTGKSRVLRAVAGNLVSGAAWYLVPGP